MNQNAKPESANKPSCMSVAAYRFNVIRRMDSLRAAALDERPLEIERVVGMTKAIQESIDQAFGQ